MRAEGNRVTTRGGKGSEELPLFPRKPIHRVVIGLSMYLACFVMSWVLVFSVVLMVIETTIIASIVAIVMLVGWWLYEGRMAY